MGKSANTKKSNVKSNVKSKKGGGIITEQSKFWQMIICSVVVNRIYHSGKIMKSVDQENEAFIGYQAEIIQFLSLSGIWKQLDYNTSSINKEQLMLHKGTTEICGENIIKKGKDVRSRIIELLSWMDSTAASKAATV